jgi:hypothetical protein
LTHLVQFAIIAHLNFCFCLGKEEL